MLRFFKQKKTNIRNCHHIDFADKVEKAFVGAGVHSPKTQYYRFKGTNELDMIAGRYNIGYKFLIEMSMRINVKDLLHYMTAIETNLTKSEIGMKEVKDVLKTVDEVRERTNLLLDNDTAIKFASVSYFDENEVLDSYDFEYNLRKIEAWKKEGDYSFFFSKPMSDLLPLPKSWQENLSLMDQYIHMVARSTQSRLNMEV